MRPNSQSLLLLAVSLTVTAPAFAADPVSLDPAFTSAVTATVDTGIQPVVDPSENVSSLPYVTPITDTGSLETSTVTPALTSSSFTLAFDQTAADLGSSDLGSADLYFIAGPNVQYTLGGAVTSNNSAGDDITTYLYDRTTGIEPYNEGVSGGTTLNFTDFGGPLTAPLTAGDEYEWFVTATLAGPTASTVVTDSLSPDVPIDTLTGPLSLTFTPAPEPSTTALFLLGASVLPFIRRRAAGSPNDNPR